MAVLNRDTYMNKISALVGERNDDDTLSIVQELSSHFDDSMSMAQPNTELQERISTLEQEKIELENTWRNKYRDAFFHGTNDGDFHGLEYDKQKRTSNNTKDNPMSFDELFK